MAVILFKRQTIETYAPTHAKRGNVPKKGEHATEIVGVYNFKKKKGKKATRSRKRKKKYTKQTKKERKKKKKKAKEKRETQRE